MTDILQFLGNIFIPHPYVALLPAIIFGTFYFKSKNKLVLATTVLWIVYAIYEELHLLRILCSGECNMRIDLLVIYPVLFIVSAIALVIEIRNITRT
ncbi:MAG: hypothetical protein RIT04_175 [Candidatus Parcubacteria bacterium]|jgi:hypothetical protein